MQRKRILTTNRLVLETFTHEDLDILWEINSDAEVMQYVNGPDTDKSETKAFLGRALAFGEANPGMGIWKLSSIDGTFLGLALINRPMLSSTGERTGPIQVGYRIHKKYWGQGYVTEITRALVDYAFNVLELDRLIAVANPLNLGSTRVMEKVGMTYQGTTDEFYNHTLVLYHIDRGIS